MSFLTQPLNGMILLLRVVAIGVTLTALLDICVHPKASFVAAGRQPKSLWIVMMVISLFFSLAGMVCAIVYFASVRPAIGATIGPAGGGDPSTPPSDEPYIRG